MPTPFEAVLLGLAAWRVWHLLAEDDLLDRPRRYITRLGDWREEGDPVPDNHRYALREFLECPFCLGAWIAGAWVVAFAIWPSGTIWAALVFAVASVPPLVNHWMSDR